jgi:prolyl oligopeptidase PreP (S9A serine peptidase family)
MSANFVNVHVFLQVSYNSEALKIYSDLENQWQTLKDLSEMKAHQQQTLSDIKALAITVD